MHELSIALNILDLAAEEAERHGGGRVESIQLRLGPLSGVVKEALLGAFEIARESSAMPNAELIIEETQLVANCPTCGTSRAVVSVQDLCCTQCGTPSPVLTSGQELELVGLTITES
jgi:hydrogenase nickel incorporation protein HypA/HybF